MRFLYFLFLVIFVAIVAIFAYQNNDNVGIRFFDQGVSLPLSLLVGVVYVLGMLSGWSVVGMLRRSLRRITSRPERSA
jgi:uncharacterized integral membrane protein